MKEAELVALHARAEAALKKIPGVVGVGYGLKEVDGRTTDQVALRVYVSAKKPRDALAPDEIVPDEFEGVPTDVLRAIEDVPLHCQDLVEHDPLVGGITVVNPYDEIGTMGFFATINGEDGWDNVVLVSNHHVLAAFSAKRGERVFQPKLIRNDDDTVSLADPAKKNPIGKIHKAGIEDVHPHTYPPPDGGTFDTYIDCATARLDICVSSWCHTNCGISYKNEVDRLDVNGSSKIADIGRIALSDIGTDRAIVYKVGRRTGPTKGRVVDAFGPRSGPGKVLVIDPIGLDCEEQDRFAAKGDSGAAIVNEQRQLVALLYGQSGLNPRQTLASHIHPVLDYLDITAITEANPPVPPAGQARADIEGLFAGGINETGQVRERLLATPRGAALYERAFAHRLEVIDMVNHCRPVTVVWHRGKGPAFLNRAINNLRHPGEPIPRAIEGVGRAELLRRMKDVLHAHGSDRLRAALDAHGEEIIVLADMYDDLRELADRLEREAQTEEQEVPCGAG